MAEALAADQDSFDAAAALAAVASGSPVNFSDLTITRATLFGRPMWFATDTWRDPIQRNHRRGAFYEQPELEALRRYVPMGATFVDIGANVGNHSLFAATFLNAACVVPVEPNPRCLRLMLLTAMLNGVLERYDTRGLGIGMSDTPSGSFGLEKRDRNIGATRMLEGEGDIPVTTADAALADLTPDFIKVDVEGMEMRVLNGLRGTLARARPRMMVEVDQENYAAFDAWVAEVGYVETEVHQRYKTNKNVLIEPGDPA
ncbi:methyltransferase, FkbM family [Roseivivax lentus]|uniref:Methyltransferase, FkbM family n=1 Tax=Roseivivax lentus TaxID=633194 RepID=A0A1N7N1V0_9RHOB|nr:FkbM family methyltransferase [Roseivivax lentus]SIS92320.1 methyltransferase, FkbM family [Roseivivax lentus]